MIVKKSKKSGFTLIESMIMVVIVGVAITALITTQTRLTVSDETIEEDIIALQACEQKIEEIRNAANLSFKTIFSTYNAASANANFDVTGLNVQDNDADGMCGIVEFPETNGFLDETNPSADTDWDANALDMDGDGLMDNNQVEESNLAIIQVRVKVQYRSIDGKDREKKIVTTIYAPS